MKQFLAFLYILFTNPKISVSIFAQVSRNSKFGKGTVIKAKALASNVQAGSKLVLGKRAKLANATLGDKIKIHPDSLIVNSTLGSQIAIYDRCKIYGSSIGSYSYLAQEVLMFNTTVGKYCSIGPRVIFGHGDHPIQRMSTHPSFYTPSSSNGHSWVEEICFEEFAPIQIGNDVWIGANAYIRHGVSIGDGAIVATGAVVTANVAPYEIVGGVPAKRIKMRFEKDVVEKLLSLSWWQWPEDKINRHLSLFKKSHISIEDLFI